MNSEIILCNDINIDKNYINVLSYSESQMVALCRSKAIATATNYSFIRDTKGILSTGFTYDQCLKANYIAFKNPDYSNKWFFAFIDEVIYKGNANTQIKFTVDAWATWYDYWTSKPCYVIRQHVNDDTIGTNLIQEDISVGDVIQESETIDSSYSNEFGYFIGLLTTYLPTDNATSGGTSVSGISIYNNVISGFDLVLFKITSRADLMQVVYFLTRINDDGKLADINSMYIIPNACIDETILVSHTTLIDLQTNPATSVSCTYYTIPMSGDSTVFNPITFNTTISKRHSFTGFTPKNNKCYVYPYNYLYVSNNQGSNNIYKYEDFTTSNCVFENQLANSIGISGRIVPKNYKGKSYDYDESLPLGKYPTCGWTGDAFTNWLTANAVNIPTQAVFGAVSSGMQIASGNLMGGVTSIASNIANLIGQFYQATLLPNIKGGQAQGDISFSGNSMGFTFRQMRVKNQFMQVIDDYFTRFGYKILRVVTPNITGRTYWNYIEIGSNEDIGYSSSNAGSVPSQFMETINNACRKGITIWHDHANIGNFSLSNTIVS